MKEKESIEEKADDTTSEFVTAAELFEIEEKQYLVNVSNGYIELKIRENDQYPYEIKLDRINNKEDMLEWVYHLSGKQWITTEHIYLFIKQISKHLNINVYDKHIDDDKS